VRRIDSIPLPFFKQISLLDLELSEVPDGLGRNLFHSRAQPLLTHRAACASSYQTPFRSETVFPNAFKDFSFSSNTFLGRTGNSWPAAPEKTSLSDFADYKVVIITGNVGVCSKSEAGSNRYFVSGRLICLANDGRK
jgi:hypothetical protein